MTNKTRDRVGIFIFDDVEVLDFCGPMEVFYTSGAFDVITVAPTEKPIRCVTGMKVTPDHAMDDCPPLDILVVPGGRGTRKMEQKPEVLNWLTEYSASVDLLTTVCTGSVLAARAGLLSGVRATTHWRGFDRLQEFAEVEVDRGARIVDAGTVITSAGISAGIDMALYVLKTRCGDSVLQRSLDSMEYDAYPEDKPEYDRPVFVRVQDNESCG